MNKNVHCQILLKCWSFITLKGWGWPSWESLEDFQTNSPLNPTFLEIAAHPPVNFEYCENDPGAPLTYFNDGGVRRIFWGLRFWPKGIFLGLWKTPGFFWVAKTTQGFFWVLYSSSAQINNNISAIYSFVFYQNQSWSWHVLAFQKINNKICWCKNTEGFFWVTNSEVGIFLGIKYVGPPRH